MVTGRITVRVRVRVTVRVRIRVRIRVRVRVRVRVKVRLRVRGRVMIRDRGCKEASVEVFRLRSLLYILSPGCNNLMHPQDAVT